MRNIKDRIEHLKNNGYALSFEATFNRTLEVFKKIMLPSAMGFLIFGTLYFMIVSGFTVSMIDTGRITPDTNWAEMMKELEFQLKNLPLRQRIIDGVIRIVMGVLVIPLLAGVIRLCRAAETGDEISFGGLFQYYHGPHFSDLFIGALIINIVTFSLGLASQYLMPMNLAAALVVLLLSLSLSVLTAIFIPLVIFGNLAPMQAITSSIGIIGKKFWLVLGLILVTSLVAMLGFLACCIGIFFTIPLLPSLQYSLYAESVGFDENVEFSDLS